MSADTILVALIVAAASLWLLRRAWLGAKNRYRKSSCCGEGCGCVKPALFGPKKPPRDKPGHPDSGRN